MLRQIRYLKFKLLSVLGLVVLVTTPVMSQEDATMVEDGKQVSFTYTLSIEGEVIESNTGREPLVYTPGRRPDSDWTGSRIGRVDSR